jgi:hypothetical protein
MNSSSTSKSKENLQQQQMVYGTLQDHGKHPYRRLWLVFWTLGERHDFFRFAVVNSIHQSD